MHVRDVAKIVQRLENEHIVLSHLTRRTSLRDAQRSLSRLVAEEVLSRITFLMDGRRRRGRAGPPPEQGAVQ
jgi:hypothetical protein